MTKAIAKLFLTAASVALCTSLQAQTTITITADRDATLYESNNGTLANGAGPSIFVGVTAQPGKRRALLHFDVAGQIPAGARVLSVELDSFSAQSTAFLPIATYVHRVTQDWNEGSAFASGPGGAGTFAGNGSATWIHTSRGTPGATWNTPGGDFDPQPSFIFDLASVGPSTATVQPGMVNDVQSWLDNPTGNFGWILKTDEVMWPTARRMHSRESSLGSLPRITVTYLIPGQVGNYGTGWLVNGSPFQLDISGTADGNAPMPIVYNNAPSPLTVGANFISFGLDPVGPTLPFGDSVYLSLSGPVITGDVFTLVGGSGFSLFNIPSGFPGYLITLQAVAIDTNLLGFSLSNAGVLLTQ